MLWLQVTKQVLYLEPSEILIVVISAPDKKGKRDNFPHYSCKTYFVTAHYNCLAETVLIRGHNMFSLINKKNYF